MNKFKVVALSIVMGLGASPVFAQRQKINNFFKEYNDSLFYTASEFLKKNDDVAALELLNKVNTGVPYYDAVLTQKLEIQYRNLNSTEVKRLIDEMRVWANGPHRVANLFEGMTYLDSKNPEKALALFDANLEMTNQKDYVSLFHKAIALYQMEKYDEAIKHLEAYLKINFLNIETHYFLGDAYLRQGRLSEALVVLSYGAQIAQGNTFEAFGGLLLSVGSMNEDATKYYKQFEQANSKSTFKKSDNIIASKTALNQKIKLDDTLSLDWFKQLKVVLENNKVKDGNTVVHQLYLPFFEKKMITNIDNYPYLVFSKKDQFVDEYLKNDSKMEAWIASAKEAVFTNAIKIGGTRIFNASERAKASSFRYFPIFRVGNASSLTMLEIEDGITLKDLMEDNFKGKVNSYLDGYLKSYNNYTSGDRTVYYDYSDQVYRKWVHSSKENYEYKSYTPSGQLVHDENFVDGKLVSLKHYYPFGNLMRETNLVSNPFQKIYYPNGQLKEYRNPAPAGAKSGLGIDTLVLKYKTTEKIKEQVLMDNEAKKILVSEYYPFFNIFTSYDAKNNVEVKRQRNNKDFYTSSKLNDEEREEKYYYPNGQLSKHVLEQQDIYTGNDMKLYREDGSQYGALIYSNGKLISGYMLSPQNDTLWDAQKIANDNKRIEVYLPEGVLEYAIKLGYDNSLFNEMNYYYANGKVKAYLSKDLGLTDYKATQYEEKYLNGNLKQDSELKDAQNAIIEEREYYTNGNLEMQVTVLNGRNREVKKFHHDGVQLSWYQYDEELGYYGDYYNYQNDGKIFKVEQVVDGITLRVRNYDNNGKLVYNKQLNAGIDTVNLFNIEGQKVGYELYKNGVNYGASYIKYSNNKIKQIKYYNDFGAYDSLVSYYPNGAIRSHQKYSPEGYVLKGTSYEFTGEATSVYHVSGDGLVKEYNYGGGVRFFRILDGEVLKEIILLNNQDTLFHTKLVMEGVVKVKYRNEKNQLVEKYLNEKDAKITAYHTNGTKALVLPLQKFVIAGDMTLYYKNAKPCLKANWKDNMYNGIYLWYNEGGKLLEEQFFAYNYPDKSYKFWDANGKLLIETEGYGKPNSIYKYWNEETQKMEIDVD